MIQPQCSSVPEPVLPEAAEAVEILPPESPLRAQALHLVLSGDSRPDPAVERRIRTLQEIVAAQGMNLEPLAVAWCGGRLASAGLVIESPGRTGIVHLSPPAGAESASRLSIAVLRHLTVHAARRGLVLLQAMVTPDEPALEDVLAAAGFRFLAELIYAERSRDSLPPRRGRGLDLEVSCYSRRKHELFIDALEQTYVQSRDCPGLGGLRRTEDVLAGHKAAGFHDPSLWFVARHKGELAGILLLSPVRGRDALEVVYMGVTPPFRRRGVGHALMRKCHREMIRGGHRAVILAVDSVNSPARELYRRWGFVETARRRAWIAACRSEPIPVGVVARASSP